MAKILIFINSVIMMINSIFGFAVMPKGYKLDPQKLASEVKTINEQRIQDGKITGSQIIVKQCGETVLDEVYGLKGVGKSKLDGNEIYRIASMTKPVTALALLIEQDRGHLNIYDDVSKYLPEFANMKVAIKDKDGNTTGTENATESIKVYQLVSHASGVGEVDITSPLVKDYALKDVCTYLASQPLHFNPGSDIEYSTGAFDVAARIIETTSGMEFLEYLKVNIFDKLGMTDTTFEPSDSQWSRFVDMHDMKDGVAVNASVFPGYIFGNFPAKYHAAGAALCSTADDYSKFAQMLLNGGVGDNGTRIISEETLKLMSTPIKDDKGTGSTKWGLAVVVRVKPGADLPVGSFGWSGAYGSHFWVDPVNKITAVYMKNSAYDGGAGNKSATEFSDTLMNCFTIKKIG